MDVAIRYGFGHWPGVTAEHLTDDAFFPVCSPHIANDDASMTCAMRPACAKAATRERKKR